MSKLDKVMQWATGLTALIASLRGDSTAVIAIIATYWFYTQV